LTKAAFIGYISNVKCLLVCLKTRVRKEVRHFNYTQKVTQAERIENACLPTKVVGSVPVKAGGKSEWIN